MGRARLVTSHCVSRITDTVHRTTHFLHSKLSRAKRAAQGPQPVPPGHHRQAVAADGPELPYTLDAACVRRAARRRNSVPAFCVCAQHLAQRDADGLVHVLLAQLVAGGPAGVCGGAHSERERGGAQAGAPGLCSRAASVREAQFPCGGWGSAPEQDETKLAFLLLLALLANCGSLLSPSLSSSTSSEGRFLSRSSVRGDQRGQLLVDGGELWRPTCAAPRCAPCSEPRAAGGSSRA